MEIRREETANKGLVKEAGEEGSDRNNVEYV